MILYFSGTGNSEYIANKLQENTDQETLNLFTRIKDKDYRDIHSENEWIIVAPTYAWRIPRIVETFLLNTKLVGNKKIYFVMSCGGSIGNADKYLKKLCEIKQMDYLGCASIVMPENYIALFSTPTKEEALKIINKANIEIDNITTSIIKHENLPQRTIKMMDKINSGVINDMFYPVFVHAKKFRVKDTCIACSKCAEVCPLNNIELVQGKPVWNDQCTHCMACINYCPKEAIEYGKHSIGLPRYICPK